MVALFIACDGSFRFPAFGCDVCFGGRDAHFSFTHGSVDTCPIGTLRRVGLLYVKIREPVLSLRFPDLISPEDANQKGKFIPYICSWFYSIVRCVLFVAR